MWTQIRFNMNYILDGKEVKMRFKQLKEVAVKTNDTTFAYYDSIHGAKENSVSFFMQEHDPKVFIMEFKEEELSQEQVLSITKNFKRADGQYIFKGNFMCREYIEEQVKKNLCVLVTNIHYIE